jgi:hypothetical protein
LFGSRDQKGSISLTIFGHEVADLGLVRVPLEPREAAPADRKTKIADEGQSVPSVDEDRIGPEARRLDAVRPPPLKLALCR